VNTRALSVLPAILAVILATACSKTPAAESAVSAATPEAAQAEPAKPMPAELPDVLARVNGEPVTKADFERLLKNIEAGRGPIPAERRDEILRAVLDQLITYNVMKQEAGARKLSVSEAEVNSQVQQMQSQFPSEAEFKQALAARDLSVDQLKADARVDMLIDRMMQAELAAAVDATEADARAFYDGNPDKFEQGESVRASHILIMANEQADAAAKQAASARMDGILKRARSGEDFAALAKEHSEDSTREQGGDLGFFPRGQMVPAFDQVAFSLKPGEISDVVATQFGYHIIKVAEKKPATTVPYDEVKGRILEFLSNQKKQERIESFIEDARKRARIEVLV
jgi:peptidyl-prolyl cis-trans isomerase C